jgi:hypothetical protein
MTSLLADSVSNAKVTSAFVDLPSTMAQRDFQAFIANCYHTVVCTAFGLEGWKIAPGNTAYSNSSLVVASSSPCAGGRSLCHSRQDGCQ